VVRSSVVGLCRNAIQRKIDVVVNALGPLNDRIFVKNEQLAVFYNMKENLITIFTCSI
jgi:hypothetical protein